MSAVGTTENPYTYLIKENNDWIFETPMLVPMGEYIVVVVVVAVIDRKQPQEEIMALSEGLVQ